MTQDTFGVLILLSIGLFYGYWGGYCAGWHARDKRQMKVKIPVVGAETTRDKVVPDDKNKLDQ